MEILTIKETAKHLNVPVSQVYNLVVQEGFPAFKIGRHWRIAKEELDKWILAQLGTR